jgi:succinyl-diaminopimelate desuccinylase
VIYAEKGILVFEIAKKLEKNHEPGLCLRSVEGGSAPNMVPDKCRAILVYEDGAGSGKPSDTRDKTKKIKTGGKETRKEIELRSRAFEHVKEAAKAFSDSLKAITCKGAGNALEITSKGISAHGSTPEKGLNAISVMIEFLSGLPLVNESVRDFVDFYHTHIGYETDGKNLGIAMEDGISGSLIVNAGTIKINSEAVVCTINVRYPVSKNESDVYGALRPALDENGLGVVKINALAPLYHHPDEPLIKTLLDVYRENTGDEENLPIVTGGGTYARSIPNAVAFGPRFPDEEDVMHQKDEYISIDSFMKAAHIYADAIYRLCIQMML